MRPSNRVRRPSALRARLLLAGVVGLASAGSALALPAEPTTGPIVRRLESMATAIRARRVLATDPEVGAYPLQVRVQGDVAILEGRVPSEALLARAKKRLLSELPAL